MPDPISLGLGAVGGLTSLFGVLGASAAQRRAEAARMQAINDISQQMDEEYNALRANNMRNLWAATGQGADAVGQLGRTLGSSLAGAGVYNSSATAGAIAQAQRDQGSQLARMASDNYANERALQANNKLRLSNLKLGVLGENLGQARTNYQNSYGGLMSALGTMGQAFIAQTGQNQLQNGLTREQGGYGNPSVLKPGAGQQQQFGTIANSPLNLARPVRNPWDLGGR